MELATSKKHTKTTKRAQQKITQKIFLTHHERACLALLHAHTKRQELDGDDSTVDGVMLTSCDLQRSAHEKWASPHSTGFCHSAATHLEGTKRGQGIGPVAGVPLCKASSPPVALFTFQGTTSSKVSVRLASVSHQWTAPPSLATRL